MASSSVQEFEGRVRHPEVGNHHRQGVRKKRPLSYDESISIFSDKKQEAFKVKDFGMRPGRSGWYTHNFVDYISDLGYHIELTGDEIEPIGGVSEVRT